MKEIELIRKHPLYLSSCKRLEELEGDRQFCRHQMPHLLDVARIAYIRSLENGLGLSLIHISGEVHYDFVEVMACKRGCIAGGGQPVPIGPRTKKARLEGLYKIDTMAQIKLSNQNPIVEAAYEGILKGKEQMCIRDRYFI